MRGFGYEGVQLSDLIHRLVDEGVDVLVDVRLNAISRKAGFSKRALSSALESAGILYVHEPRLGNVKDNRAAYAQLDSAEGLAARQRFRDRLAEPDAAAGVQALVDLEGSVAVFCYEADERHCHRQQVLEAARDLSLVGV